MYESFFRLNRKPFSAAPDPAMYVPSPSAERASKRLTYAVTENIGGFLLTGPAGCGKTLLLEKLSSTGAAAHEFLFVRAGKMDGDALAMALLRAAAIYSDDPAAFPDRNAAMHRLGEYLAAKAQSGRRLTVIIDGAELVSNDGLSVLEMFNDLRRNGTFLATFVLAGTESLSRRVLSLPGLRDRLALSARLEPLDMQATVAYVTGRLAAAGSQEPIFNDDALAQVFAFAKGVPRRVNRVADLALLTAFGLESPTVNYEVMTAVIEEMSQTPI